MSDQDHPDDIEGVGSAEEPSTGPQGDWDPSAHRLPIWATISEAVQAIGKEWKALLKATMWPTLAVAAINVLPEVEYPSGVDTYLQDIGFPVPLNTFGFGVGLLSAGFAMPIAISCHRLVILGVDSLPSAWGLFWSRRETRFLGWSALIGGIAWVVLLVAAFSLEYGVLPLSLVLLFVLVGYFVYVIPRLSLVLPATAIGQRLTLDGSWRLSRSNGWRLALVMLLPSLLLGMLYRVGSLLLDGTAPQFLSAFIGVLVAVLSWVIGIAALSKAFCWFTGESEPSTPA